jgi:hypothetical protein
MRTASTHSPSHAPHHGERLAAVINGRSDQSIQALIAAQSAGSGTAVLLADAGRNLEARLCAVRDALAKLNAAKPC